MEIHTSETAHQTHTPHHEVKGSKFEKASFIVFIATLLLLPFVFFPDSYAPFEITKTMIAVGGTLITTLCLVFSALKKKTLAFPRHPLTYALVAVLATTLVSGLLSGSIWKSFIGQGFEMGTVSFLVLMSVVAFLAGYFVFEKKDRIFHIYGAILGSFAILSIFHLVRLFVKADFLSFGILNTITSSLIGSWNDLGIFAALVLLLSYVGIKYLAVGKGLKTVLVVFAIVAAFMVFVVNFSIMWLGLALVFLALALYDFAHSPASKTFKKISIVPVLFAILSVVLALQGVKVATLVQNAFNIIAPEVSLSWQTNLNIASATLQESPVFGAGPNRFTNEYLRFKPVGINTTVFWNTEFATGSGFIPTTLVTGGVLGFAAWVLFLILFVRAGTKQLRVAHVVGGEKVRFIMLSTFTLGLFLWIMNTIDAPSHAIFFLTFVLTGIFIASLALSGVVTYKHPGKALKPFAIAIIALCIIWAGVYVKKAVALAYFRSGIHALNSTDPESVNRAEVQFEKALAVDESDVYYQAMSEVTIMKITALATEIEAKNDPEKVKQIPPLVAFATDATSKAIAVDPTNYYNYVSQARISEVGASMGITNAYENAKSNYTQAIALNPTNPSLYLNLARLEASQKKMDEALKNIGKALELKANYTDAIFFLSQLQVSAGKIDEAITSVQYATQINPENPLLHFQLGLLYYNDKQYPAAATSLSVPTSSAITISS